MTLPPLPAPLLDRFAPQEVLGCGGMGIVFAALDLKLGRRVALKVIHATLGDDDGKARFRREGRLLGQLSHPAIVRLYDADVADGVPYLAMELLQGEPLGASIADASLPAREVAALLDSLLAALAHVHERGLLHRDLKPSNVMLRNEGSPVLIDFGLVWGGGATAITRTGALLGTPRYLAPELITGAAYSPASDLFALGLLAVEALTRADLHAAGVTGKGIEAVISSLSSGAYHAAAVPLLRQHGRLGEILLRAIAPEPADRWPGAQAMREALAELLAAVTVPAGNVIPLGPVREPRAMSAAWTTMRKLAPDGVTGVCQVCGDPMDSELVRCERCDTLHHRACWDYIQGCPTFACRAQFVMFTRTRGLRSGA